MAKDEKGEKKPILKAKEETIVDKVKVRGYWCYLTFLEILRYQYNGMNENYEKFIRYNKGYGIGFYIKSSSPLSQGYRRIYNTFCSCIDRNDSLCVKSSYDNDLWPSIYCNRFSFLFVLNFNVI